MSPPPLSTLALCAGVGGLELGLRQVLHTRVVGWVERMPYAQRVLHARMAEGRLDRAPLWADLRRFDPSWCGPVDLVAAGFPCQPYSPAGKKRGPDDPRDLWPHVARVVATARPALVALENVARLVRARGGLERVLADLAALGFDAEWEVVTAAEAGAPHRRARIFLLAWRLPHAGLDALRLAAERGERGEAERWDALAGDLDESVAHAGGDRRGGRLPPHDGDGCHAPRDDADGRHAELVPAPARQRGLFAAAAGVEHTGGPGRQGLIHAGEPGEVRAGGGPLPAPWPPGPGDRAGWERVLAARPDLVPAVRRVADGTPAGLDRDPSGRLRDRAKRLHVLGNAVVPAQAARAFAELTQRALAGD